MASPATCVSPSAPRRRTRGYWRRSPRGDALRGGRARRDGGGRALARAVAAGGRARASALAACVALWRAVGACVETLDAAAHDQALALVSHLPHAAAFALAAAVGGAADDGAPIAGLWGGGFVDTTRIAGSDPEMW